VKKFIFEKKYFENIVHNTTETTSPTDSQQSQKFIYLCLLP